MIYYFVMLEKILIFNIESQNITSMSLRYMEEKYVIIG